MRPGLQNRLTESNKKHPYIKVEKQLNQYNSNTIFFNDNSNGKS